METKLYKKQPLKFYKTGLTALAATIDGRICYEVYQTAGNGFWKATRDFEIIYKANCCETKEDAISACEAHWAADNMLGMVEVTGYNKEAVERALTAFKEVVRQYKNLYTNWESDASFNQLDEIIEVRAGIKELEQLFN